MTVKHAQSFRLIEETKLYVEINDMSQASAALEAVKEQAAGRRVHIRLCAPALARLHESMAKPGLPTLAR